MSSTRREFLKHMGVSIASLMVARCAPRGSGGDTPQDRVRQCWLELETLAGLTQKDFERGEALQEQLVANHRAGLDELVAAGVLEAAVADHVQIAFVEAVYHVWRSNAPITCYEPVLIDYTPTSSGQLAQQVDVLADLAQEGDLDSATVAQAQAAIAHDIAFLTLTDEEMKKLYDELTQGSGGGYDFPSFDELDLEISPEAAEAARFLVALLLEP